MNVEKIKSKLSLSKLSPIAIVLLALFLAGAFSFALSKTIQQSSIKFSQNIKPKAVNKIEITPSTTDKVSSGQQNTETQLVNSETILANPTGITKTTYTTVSTTATSNSQQNSISKTNPDEKKINLSLNGGAGFEVKISDSANQCDVLSNALQQGKIQSLNMRYDNSLGSNAVYQINGIGKENSVWWTYKVNGQSPSQGCSYIKASSGDNIEWKYIGS